MTANKATPEELVKRLREDAATLDRQEDDFVSEANHIRQAADPIESLVQKKGDTSSTVSANRHRRKSNEF